MVEEPGVMLCLPENLVPCRDAGSKEALIRQPESHQSNSVGMRNGELKLTCCVCARYGDGCGNRGC